MAPLHQYTKEARRAPGSEWIKDHPAILEIVYDLSRRVVVRVYPLVKRLGQPLGERLMAWGEEVLKGWLFNCQMCGQCILHSTGMTCPMNCPKKMRNGPCGGVRSNGCCEVIPERPCIWAQAWERGQRMRRYADDLRILQQPVNYALQNTSAWANMIEARDGPPPGWAVAKFAADIGAEIVTFQPGYRERQVDEQMETVERNIEFSKEAVKLARELGLVLGYQNLPAGARGPMNSKAMLNEIFREVDDPALGLLFDPAWAIKERALSSTDMTAEFILPWFEELGLRIIKLHVHGILACNPFGYLHHQPLWQDNCHDFPLLVSYIKRYSPHVPLIFKIIGRDADTALRLAKEGLDYLGGLF